MFKELKLKRVRIVELYHVLDTTIFDSPIGNRCRYMITKNIEAAKKEIEEIDLAFPAPKGLTEYVTARQEIYKKYSIKSDDDYKELPEETKKSLDDEIKVIEDTNKTLLDEVDALDKDKGEFLEEEVPIKLYQIEVDQLPIISQKNKHSDWDIWAVFYKSVLIEPED